jgi:DNA repair protein RadC
MYEGFLLQHIELRLQVKQRAHVKVIVPNDIATYLRPIFEGEHREIMVSIPLNARHEVLGYRVCHVGTLNSCPVGIAEMFLPAILSGARAIICAHNHPSGDCTPSPEDERVTARLTEAGDLLGIHCLDHLVITCTHFHSMADRRSYPYYTGEEE